MKTPLASLLVPALLLTSVVAQEGEGFDMSPAKQLQVFAPLIGNWSGDGTMLEPSGEQAKWTAHGTYQWSLNKHFVQEDFIVHFVGLETPIVFRNYLGWDRENQRYVSVVCGNQGLARLNEVHVLADGTMMTFMEHRVAGVPHMERARTKVTGGSLSMVIDLLMADGASMSIIDSKLTRTDKVFAGDWSAGGWDGAKPGEAMQKLGLMAGRYDVLGEMIMEPGMPAMKITGSDTFDLVWDGNVLHSRTDGFADDAPDAYEAHAFWAWDAEHKCMSTVYVDNIGQVGEMQARWVKGQLVSTSSAVAQGMPTTQRFIITLDDKGCPKSGIGHTAMGIVDPFTSFKATYTKK